MPPGARAPAQTPVTCCTRSAARASRRLASRRPAARSASTPASRSGLFSALAIHAPAPLLPILVLGAAEGDQEGRVVSGSALGADEQSDIAWHGGQQAEERVETAIRVGLAHGVDEEKRDLGSATRRAMSAPASPR